MSIMENQMQNHMEGCENTYQSMCKEIERLELQIELFCGYQMQNHGCESCLLFQMDDNYKWACVKAVQPKEGK